MQVRDIMTSKVLTVGPDSSVVDIAKLLLEQQISAVPVVDTDGQLLGIVSEADLMRRAETRTERQRSWWLQLFLGDAALAEEYTKSHGVKAKDVMTRDVIVVAPDTDLDEVVATLEANHIKRLPVTEKGKLIGIISRSNLLRALLASRRKIETAAQDRAIRAMLLQELKTQRWGDMPDHAIVVVDGVVSFWGVVGSEEERRALRVAAENVPGVRSIEDRTTIQQLAYPTAWSGRAL